MICVLYKSVGQSPTSLAVWSLNRTGLAQTDRMRSQVMLEVTCDEEAGGVDNAQAGFAAEEDSDNTNGVSE